MSKTKVGPREEKAPEVVIHTFSGQGYDWAINRLKMGKLVSRAGWNGSGMFVMMNQGKEVYIDEVYNPALKKWMDNNCVSPITFRPSLSLKTAQGDIAPGWSASHSDMLAEDWFEVEP